MFVFFVLFVVSFADITLQAEWSYGHQAKWPGVCTVGKLQSPINISTREAVVDKDHAHIRGPLVFRGYKDVELTAFNDGHTLQWAGVKGKPAPVLSGGPLKGNYTFLQVHFHWLSEHAIDGMKYPMEAHLVHVKAGMTFEQALESPDGVAVIGVLFVVHKGLGSERALEQLIPMVPFIADSSQNKTDPQRLDVSRLLSLEPQSYYTYRGSLTTPRCQEVVVWIFMDKPVFITANQYKMFLKVDVGGDYNYRSLQPTNNRVIYRSIASCASIVAPTVPGTLLSLLSCLSTALAAGVNKGVGAVYNVKRKLFGESIKKCVKLN